VISKEYESSIKSFTYETYKAYLRKAFPMISNYQYKVDSFETSKDREGFIIKVGMKEMYFVGKKYIKEKHDQSWWVVSSKHGLKVKKIVIHN